MLNDKMLPFFEEQGVNLLRVLTDRGTEYCGYREHHEYELYLSIEDVDHSKTKAKSPQTNGICERFHRTQQDEFYAIAFRKKMYGTLEEMQADLDLWLDYYNKERPHSGRYCYGKTPMQTWEDSRELTKEKDLLSSFRRSDNFNVLQEAEAGSAGEHPARNTADDGNERAADIESAALSQNHFYHNAS